MRPSASTPMPITTPITDRRFPSSSLLKKTQNKKVTEFLKTILGRPVIVKLNSGVDYRGAACVRACEEGVFVCSLGCVVRCVGPWNGMFVAVGSGLRSACVVVVDEEESFSLPPLGCVCVCASVEACLWLWGFSIHHTTWIDRWMDRSIG